MFALPSPEDVLQALAEDLGELLLELSRETPALAALSKSARLAARSYLVKVVGSTTRDASRHLVSPESGAAMLPHRRRSSIGDAGSDLAAFTAVRDLYAGAITSSRRANAASMLVAALDEAAELDWLQVSGKSAATIISGSDAQVSM